MFEPRPKGWGANHSKFLEKGSKCRAQGAGGAPVPRGRGRAGRRRDTWEGTILGNWQVRDSARVWGSPRLPQAWAAGAENRQRASGPAKPFLEATVVTQGVGTCQRHSLWSSSGSGGPPSNCHELGGADTRGSCVRPWWTRNLGAAAAPHDARSLRDREESLAHANGPGLLTCPAFLPLAPHKRPLGRSTTVLTGPGCSQGRPAPTEGPEEGPGAGTSGSQPAVGGRSRGSPPARLGEMGEDRHSTLGYPLLETQPAGATMAAPPRAPWPKRAGGLLKGSLGRLLWPPSHPQHPTERTSINEIPSRRFWKKLPRRTAWGGGATSSPVTQSADSLKPPFLGFS